MTITGREKLNKGKEKELEIGINDSSEVMAKLAQIAITGYWWKDLKGLIKCKFKVKGQTSSFSRLFQI